MKPDDIRIKQTRSELSSIVQSHKICLEPSKTFSSNINMMGVFGGRQSLLTSRP